MYIVCPRKLPLSIYSKIVHIYSVFLLIADLKNIFLKIKEDS